MSLPKLAMNNEMSRREFVTTAASGLVSFVPAACARTVSEASRAVPHKWPRVHGTWLDQMPTRAEFGMDAGNMELGVPNVVLRPGSANYVLRAVRFARQHDIKLAMRGLGHTHYGQSLVGNVYRYRFKWANPR